MEPMSTMAIVGVAIKAIGSGIELIKDSTPTWEQKQIAKAINKQKYITDLYELEMKKPKYKEGEDNENARSTDRMLNLRDLVLQHGLQVIEAARSTKS